MLVLIPIVGAVIGLFFLVRHLILKGASNRARQKTGKYWEEVGKKVLAEKYIAKTTIDDSQRKQMLSTLKDVDKGAQIYFFDIGKQTEVYIKTTMSASNEFRHRYVDSKQLVFKDYIFDYDKQIKELDDKVAGKRLEEERTAEVEIPRRKYFVLKSVLNNGSSGVDEIKYNEEELYNVRKDEVAAILNDLNEEGYISRDENNRYDILNKELTEEFLKNNSIFYKKDGNLTKEEKEASYKEVRRIILDCVNKEKWYSIKDLKELDGRLQLLSSQKMSNILKSMVDEKVAKSNGTEYKFC